MQAQPELPLVLVGDLVDGARVRRIGAAVAAAGAGTLFNPTNCANSFSVWGIGSRWQYNFTPAFYVGFDVLYQKLVTADSGGTITFLGGGNGGTNPANPSTVYQVTNQDQWQFRLRLHRDILP